MADIQSRGCVYHYRSYTYHSRFVVIGMEKERAAQRIISMSCPKKIVCPHTAAGSRIDLFIAEQYPAISRSKIQQFIDAGFVSLNGASIKKNTVLKGDDEIVIDEEELVRSAEVHL